MSEHLSSATRIHGDANASAAWTSYCPNSKSGSSADLGHTFCASLRPHLSRPAAINAKGIAAKAKPISEPAANHCATGPNFQTKGPKKVPDLSKFPITLANWPKQGLHPGHKCGEQMARPGQLLRRCSLHLICQLSASCRLISKTNPEDGLRCPGLPFPFACGLAPLEVLAWQLMIQSAGVARLIKVQALPNKLPLLH